MKRHLFRTLAITAVTGVLQLAVGIVITIGLASLAIGFAEREFERGYGSDVTALVK